MTSNELSNDRIEDRELFGKRANTSPPFRKITNRDPTRYIACVPTARKPTGNRPSISFSGIPHPISTVGGLLEQRSHLESEMLQWLDSQAQAVQGRSLAWRTS